MEQVLNEMNEIIEAGDKTDDKVSAVGTYWQVDHSLRVIIGVCRTMKESDPSTFKKGFNPTWAYIKTAGKIPRGKGRAPKAVVPEEVGSKEKLLAMLAQARKELSEIEELTPNHYFDHHIFGKLNQKNTKKFLKIHTVHHLKIARDILARRP